MAVAMKTGGRIESLLSARLFLNPQLAGDKLYFISDLAGRLSLYRMDVGGSVPEPLLPPGIALQNPELLGGYGFYALPELDRIVLMLDQDGDENYQPRVIPLDGGFPEPLNEDVFGGMRTHLVDVDEETATGYAFAESHEEAKLFGIRIDLATGEAEILGEGMHGPYPVAWTRDHSRTVLGDGYTAGDIVLYERDPETGEKTMLWGTLLEDREEGAEHPLLGMQSAHVTDSQQGLLISTSLFDDAYGPGYIAFDKPGEVEPVELTGARHEGVGELERFQRIEGDQYRRRVQHRRRLVGLRGRLRRDGPRDEARPRARGRRRARRRRPARHRP